MGRPKRYLASSTACHRIASSVKGTVLDRQHESRPATSLAAAPHPIPQHIRNPVRQHPSGPFSISRRARYEGGRARGCPNTKQRNTPRSAARLASDDRQLENRCPYWNHGRKEALVHFRYDKVMEPDGIVGTGHPSPTRSPGPVVNSSRHRQRWLEREVKSPVKSAQGHTSQHVTGASWRF